ncbi:hypothetical protein ACFSUK_13045 [Sphingobium scionense]
MLRVSIPIFVTAPGAQASLAWQLTATNDRQLMLTARNEGSAHVHLNRLDLKRADGTPLATRQESIYILPGATRSFLFDMQRAGARRREADAGRGHRPAHPVRAARPPGGIPCRWDALAPFLSCPASWPVAALPARRTARRRQAQLQRRQTQRRHRQ